MNSVTWTPDTLRAAIVSHITNVAGYYAGKCYAWDVVNEALEDDGSWRNSLFYKVLGEEYIELAFRTAAEVDPHAKLYYNDYNLEWPSKKTEAVKTLVKKLRAKGVKIDGVGLQAHLTAEGDKTLDQHVEAIQGFADLGVDVALTELDIRLKTPATAENLALQREKYKNVSCTAPFTSPRKKRRKKGGKGMMANGNRLSVLVSRLRGVWVSRSGTSMTPLAGCRMCSLARARRACGLRTSRPTRLMMALLRR